MRRGNGERLGVCGLEEIEEGWRGESCGLVCDETIYAVVENTQSSVKKNL